MPFISYALGLRGGITLGQSGSPVSHTGDTNEVVLATIPLPAGTLGPNGVARISLLCDRNAAGTAVAYFNVRLGLKGAGVNGTQIGQAALQIASSSGVGYGLIINQNATNVQVGARSYFGTNSSASFTAAIDTTQACEIVLSGKLNNAADSLTLDGYLVEIFQH